MLSNLVGIFSFVIYAYIGAKIVELVDFGTYFQTVFCLQQNRMQQILSMNIL